MDANFSIKAETKTQILAVVSSEQKEKILLKKAVKVFTEYNSSSDSSVDLYFRSQIYIKISLVTMVDGQHNWRLIHENKNAAPV